MVPWVKGEFQECRQDQMLRSVRQAKVLSVMPSTEGFTGIFVSSFVMMRQTKMRAGSQAARRQLEKEKEKGV